MLERKWEEGRGRGLAMGSQMFSLKIKSWTTQVPETVKLETATLSLFQPKAPVPSSGTL